MRPVVTHPNRLVVVPSDSIASIEAGGWGANLKCYFNPAGVFGEVHVVSPLEPAECERWGLSIHPSDDARFARDARRLRPDVIRAYGGYWPSDLVCHHRVRGVPIVVSVHDRRPEMIHESVAYADLVICVSQACARGVVARGCAPSRIRVIPNRIDRRLFRPIEAAEIPRALASRFPPGRHILHVGRKSPEKNLDTLLRALALLPADYSVIAVGPGDAEVYARLARDLKVERRYFAIEAVPNDELPAWYSWCDCMCVPSRSEGFGIVFIEAVACGAVVVTSAVAPMTEYLTHDRSAVLVAAYEDPASLAAALRSACEDTALRARVGAGAIEAVAPFDSEKVERMEADLYREAMGLRRPDLARRHEIRRWLARLALDRLRVRVARGVATGRLSAGRVKRGLDRFFRKGR